jgi:transglutaminase-like putative cysteine protease
MRYKIKHVTEYAYQDPVGLCHNRLCLTPSNNAHQTCIKSDIKISPLPDSFLYRQDFFGNRVAFVSSYKDHDHLEITSVSEVEMLGRHEMDQAVASPVLWQEVKQAIAMEDKDDFDVIQCTLPSMYIPLSPEVRKFSEDCFIEDATLWSVCNTLMKKINKTIEFKPGFTTVNTPVEEVLINKKGVCQDFAHLMISCLRNMGLAARYVSGYIETIPPPGKEKLLGTDASHAWSSYSFRKSGCAIFTRSFRIKSGLKYPSSRNSLPPLAPFRAS